MSEEQKGTTVRVLNEEYTRVLTNPENVIVSEDLQELLDIPLVDNQGEDIASLREIDTMSLTVLDSDGLAVSVRGDFVGLSRTAGSYSMTVACTSIKKQFLQSLDSLSKNPGLLAVSGVYELEINDCEVNSWLVTQTAADFSLTVHFRSENGIF